MINSQHPAYQALHSDWTLMQDTYAGEGEIKGKGDLYLPPTPSQLIDGMQKAQIGYKNYERYKQRAVFWDYVSDAVESLVGLLHQKPSTIEVPKGMETLLTNASREGENLQQLLRRINAHQLVSGRTGLLVDMPESPDPSNPIPYLALYNAQTIINWNDSDDGNNRNKVNLVVLDETSDEQTNDFAWQKIEKYRVLQVRADIAKEPAEGEAKAVVAAPAYKSGLFRLGDGETFNADLMTTPMLRGKTLDYIPFVFINSKDIIATPDNPPLLGLARLCLAIYRGEADYRQSLFMQGQDTLVIVGGSPEPAETTGVETPIRVGAGAKIDVNLGGDAKYIGVSSTGLPEQRISLENDKISASTKAGQLVSPQAGKQESGDALHTRISAQTATLQQIALTGAAGLQQALRICAEWMGLNPEEVKVIANTEFVDHFMTSKDLSDLMDARAKGAPVSLQSIHSTMVARGMTDKTFEEELAQVIKEKALAGAEPPVVTPPVTAPTKNPSV